MGGRVWTRDEELVFWEQLIPHTSKRLEEDRGNPEKSWAWVAEQMGEIMGEKARRHYTEQGVFEHYHQNTVQGRFSPRTGKLPMPYYQREKRIREEQRRRREEKASTSASKNTSADDNNEPDAANNNANSDLLAAQDTHPALVDAKGPILLDNCQYRMPSFSYDYPMPPRFAIPSAPPRPSPGASFLPQYYFNRYLANHDRLGAGESEDNGLFVTQPPTQGDGAVAARGYGYYYQQTSDDSWAERMRARLEVPIFGPGDGALAISLGVGRLELNRTGSYPLGGITPTIPELTTLLASLPNSNNSNATRPAIRIMIRPRGPPGPSTTDPSLQDFLYTPAELAAMTASIREFTASNLLDASKGDGFVFGILKRDEVTGRLELDIERNRELVRLAAGDGEGPLLRCVLHRAVDEVLTGLDVDTSKGADRCGEVMDQVRQCGFDGVLTSGGRGRATDEANVARLKGIVEGKGGFEVIVGGGDVAQIVGWLTAPRIGHAIENIMDPGAEHPGHGS
ncbi:hypothetical protein VTI74DRAFT_103 [Chaetomium olivicolor]